jgi:hypothetical protein
MRPLIVLAGLARVAAPFLVVVAACAIRHTPLRLDRSGMGVPGEYSDLGRRLLIGLILSNAVLTKEPQ